ncbi:MAG: dimethyl sulfone monooxygenase SfnG [Pseudomonadota bacterium]
MSSQATSEQVKFAYWVPNVSGGLVVSKIPQRTDWSLDYNVKLAQLAETAGFEYALSQIRFTAGYGAEYQHESVSFSQALLQATTRLKVLAAILPGPWEPAVVAKQLATIDLSSRSNSTPSVWSVNCLTVCKSVWSWAAPS